MRDRKPCFLARRRLFGWKVRFTAKPLIGRWPGTRVRATGRDRAADPGDHGVKRLQIRDRTGSNGTVSVPARSRSGQPDRALFPLWTNSCGVAYQRCTVPDRPAGSRPGAQGEHTTTTGAPGTMTPQVHLADAPDVDAGPSPPRTRPCASRRDDCAVHTCGYACGNRR